MPDFHPAKNFTPRQNPPKEQVGSGLGVIDAQTPKGKRPWAKEHRLYAFMESVMTKQVSANDDDHAKFIKAIKDHVLTEARIDLDDVEVRISNRGGYDLRTNQVPIDYYFRRGLLSHDEYNAANKLYRDFVLSAQTSRMIMNLDPIKSGEKNFTVAQMEARERWREAIMAIHGSIAKIIMIDVCCYGYWLKDTHYKHYKTSQERMARFHEALEDLVMHYFVARNSK